MSRLSRSQALLENIGYAVAKRRAELDLSQEQLAERAGLHRTYVSDVERGMRNLSVLTLERLADALDIPIGALMLMGAQAQAQAKDSTQVLKRSKL
jgi:transcriptional regulator with XRE-family HTH domain